MQTSTRSRVIGQHLAWQRWLRGLLAMAVVVSLGLLLAACGGGDDDDGGDPPVDGDAPQDTAPDPDATEEVADDGFEFLPAEPGLNVQSGLTLLRTKEGQLGDTAYFFAEIRNDTGASVRAIDVTIYPLDDENYQIGYVDGSSLLEDIPPGQVVYAGTSFPLPDAFAATQVWVQAVPGRTQRTGYFELPATVESQGPGEQAPYVVRGTAQNDSESLLLFPIITVVLIGPDDDLVGVTRAVVRTSTVDGSWPAGESVEFEAQFSFIALDDPSLVSDVIIAASGYEPLTGGTGAE